MNKTSLLQLQAIQAAKNGNWELALTKNSELISKNPSDIGALNRSAIAYLQLGKTIEAIKMLEKVLEIDKSNQIAKKHLADIKGKKRTKKPSFSTEQFIEEPGVTKIVELHRLANKSILQDLDVGQRCSLIPKNRYISVETSNGEHIGALPEDLSYRLTKLIKRGNIYECFVHSASEKECLVYIKEVVRSKKNEYINSFPLNRTSVAAINDVDERFLLEENIPVTIINTDDDTEKSIDDIDSSEEDENN
jgi:tetratricopeptide (TPR) repeat protein